VTYQYKPGLGNVASYQASGKPFVSASVHVPGSGSTAGTTAEPHELNFPYITRTLVVRNDSSNDIRVGFSRHGIRGGESKSYFTLGEDVSLEMEFKVKSVFLLSDGATAATCTVVAGLTGIPTTELLNNWSGSSGIG